MVSISCLPLVVPLLNIISTQTQSELNFIYQKAEQSWNHNAFILLLNRGFFPLRLYIKSIDSQIEYLFAFCCRLRANFPSQRLLMWLSKSYFISLHPNNRNRNASNLTIKDLLFQFANRMVFAGSFEDDGKGFYFIKLGLLIVILEVPKVRIPEGMIYQTSKFHT